MKQYPGRILVSDHANWVQCINKITHLYCYTIALCRVLLQDSCYLGSSDRTPIVVPNPSENTSGTPAVGYRQIAMHTADGTERYNIIYIAHVNLKRVERKVRETVREREGGRERDRDRDRVCVRNRARKR